MLATGMIVAESSALSAQTTTFSFSALLGVDTVAIERVILSKTTLRADVVIRSPQTRLHKHLLTIDEHGMLLRLTAEVLDPASGSVLSSTVYVRDGDSILVEETRQGRTNGYALAAPAEALPFIDLVHWPFDHLLRSMRSGGKTAWNAPMITRQRLSEFPLAFFGTDSATVTHPTRGTMRLSLNAEGGLLMLDAGATTRALIVRRGGDVDVGMLAKEYAARDVVGRGMGALSGRDSMRMSIQGAALWVDYGTPEKRGREIWGKLVKYGKLWRTGANRATHFSTSKALTFGALEVPPGTYTLFSIPEESGGFLMINKQTGQNGQSHDASRDLGRVPMRARDLDDTVEVFTIRLDEEKGKGLIRLQWDGKEYVAEFEVKFQ
jgi:hypothetical protein